MCRVGGGIFRCASQVSTDLNALKARQQTARQQIADYSLEHKDAFNEVGEPVDPNSVEAKEFNRLNGKLNDLAERVKEKQFEYDSTPSGQADLDRQIEDYVNNGREVEALELIARKQASGQFRAKHRKALDELDDIYKNQGPDAALADVMRRLKETQEQMNATLEAKQELLNRADKDEIEEAELAIRRGEDIDYAMAERNAKKLSRKFHTRALIGHGVRTVMITTALTLYLIDLYAQAVSGEKKSFDKYATMLMVGAGASFVKSRGRKQASKEAKEQAEAQLEQMKVARAERAEKAEQELIARIEKNRETVATEREERKQVLTGWTQSQLNSTYREFTRNSDEKEKQFFLDYFKNATGFTPTPSPRERPARPYDFTEVIAA